MELTVCSQCFSVHWGCNLWLPPHVTNPSHRFAAHSAPTCLVDPAASQTIFVNPLYW
jgi:hypothetical protein